MLAHEIGHFLGKQDLRLVNLETWVDGSSRRYAGVFRAGTDDDALWVNDDWYGFHAQWGLWRPGGYAWWTCRCSASWSADPVS